MYSRAYYWPMMCCIQVLHGITDTREHSTATVRVCLCVRMTLSMCMSQCVGCACVYLPYSK